MLTRQGPSVPSTLGSPWRSSGRVLLTFVVLTLAGCSAFLRDTPAPIPTLATQLSPAGPATTLVVFLPGRGGSMADFDRHGFTAGLREAGVSADTIVVDAHLGYYFKRTVIERLRTDVLVPARARGYRRIVLAGLSLGGLGALLGERDAPGLVDAIVLIAPYLGDKAALFEQIRAAGGPAAWAAARDPIVGSVEEQLWTFLGNRSATLPSTWLIYGRGDSLATGHQMLATLLPPERVRTVTGAHDWPTWLSLWREVCLNSELFAAERAGAIARRPDPANGKPE